MDPSKVIHAYPPSSPNHGFEITLSTTQSRKTFHLPPCSSNPKPPPVATESFSLDQEEYFELLKSVEALYR